MARDTTADSRPVTPTVADRLRPWRGPATFLVALAIVGVVVSLGATPTPTGDLHPQSPEPEGSRAVVEIAQDQGTEVEMVSDVDGAAAALPGPGDTAEDVDETDGAAEETLVVLVNGQLLSQEQAEQFAELPAHQMIVEPATSLLDTAVPDVAIVGDTQGSRPGECELPAAQAAGSATMEGSLLAAEDTAAQECYPAGSGALLLHLDGDEQAQDTTLLGSGDPFRNEALTSDGNAALGLNLLQEHDRVVWLYPDPATPPDGTASVWDLLPGGLYLAVAQLTLALGILVVWRSRRLGPLVTERLPVVVRAAETTEGRARLYAARRARGQAADALRSAVLDRLRPLLGLDVGAEATAVVAAVAERSGRDPTEVHRLLYATAEPTGTAATATTAGAATETETDIDTDTALVRLADELDALEREVRH